MNRIFVILVLIIFLLNLDQILMLNSLEYSVQTCCSLNENDQISFSCSSNEEIRLNLVEIYYNSHRYCSSLFNCCQMKTSCFRRITKYFKSFCDGQTSCTINKTCFPISQPCSQGAYGQYLTIHYSCLETNHSNDQQEEEEEENSFIVNLRTSNGERKKSDQISFLNYFKSSSPVFFFFILFLFLFSMLIIYCLTQRIARRFCHQEEQKTKLSDKEILLQNNNNEEKTLVQSSSSSSPRSNINCYSNEQIFPYRTYIHVQHHPITGQIYSRTFYSYPY